MSLELFPKSTVTEARFLIDGETFEHRSITYRVIGSIECNGDTVDVYVWFERPDGKAALDWMVFPARLAIEVTGQWLESE